MTGLCVTYLFCGSPIKKQFTIISILVVSVSLFNIVAVTAGSLCERDFKVKTQNEIKELEILANTDLNLEIKNKFKKIEFANRTEFKKSNFSKINELIKKDNSKFENKDLKINQTISINEKENYGKETKQFEYSDGAFGFIDRKFNFSENNGKLDIVYEKEYMPISDGEIYKGDNIVNLKNEIVTTPKTLESVKNEKNQTKDILKAKINQLKNQISIECTPEIKSDAQAVNYNGNIAKDYALNWTLRRNLNYPDFQNSGGDCTNFASQVVQAGGLKLDWNKGPIYNSNDKSNTANWYVGKDWVGNFENSKSWSSVQHFASHMYVNENTSNWKSFQTSGYSIFDSLYTGDLLFAEFSNNGKDHAMIMTGWDIVSGHWEPRLTYHTTDRQNISMAWFLANGGSNKLTGLKIFGTVW